MDAADKALAREIDALELRPGELLRHRHATAVQTPATGAGNGISASRHLSATPVLWSHAAAWTSDSAAAQLAALLYGGAKPYTTAIRGLCKRIDADMAAEIDRRDAAATRVQAIARGRSSRLEVHAKPKPRPVRSFQQPMARDGANATVGLNKTALRKHAGGRYSGTAIRFDPASLEGKSVQQALREALTANATRATDLFRDWE